MLTRIFVTNTLLLASISAGSGYYTIPFQITPPNQITQGPGTTRTQAFSQDNTQTLLADSIITVGSSTACDSSGQGGLFVIYDGSIPSDVPAPSKLVPVQLTLTIKGFVYFTVSPTANSTFYTFTSGTYTLMLPTYKIISIGGTGFVFPPNGTVDGTLDGSLCDVADSGAEGVAGLFGLTPPFPGNPKSSFTASIKLAEPLQGGIEVLDPPLNGDGQAFRTLSGIDPSFAALGGVGSTPVQYVAADGVTQVVLRIPARALGDTLTVTVGTIPFFGSASFTPSNSLTDDGGLAPSDGSSPFSSDPLQVQATNRFNGQYVAYVVYRAPTNRDLSARTVIQVDAPNSSAEYAPVTIVPPPVVLIHGLWGNPEAWNTVILPTLASFGFQTCPVDYHRTSGDAVVVVNVPIVQQQLDACIAIFRHFPHSAEAVTAVDVIAHSMGGLIARAIAGSGSSYATSNTYGQGSVHKLITLDTPHLGSTLANNLYTSDLLSCQPLFNHKHAPIGDAIRDLRTFSEIVDNLRIKGAHSLMTNAVVGIASDAQTAATESTLPFWILTKALCPGLLTNGSFKQTFAAESIFGDGSSDLIVSDRSQEAIGLGAGGSPIPITTFNTTSTFGIIHTLLPGLFSSGPDAFIRTLDSTGQIVPYGSGVPGYLINLLNGPVTGSGSLFAPILP